MPVFDLFFRDKYTTFTKEPKMTQMELGKFRVSVLLSELEQATCNTRNKIIVLLYFGPSFLGKLHVLRIPP